MIAKAEARVQWRTGPSIFQPYYDIWKFFRKESVRPDTASPFFELAPLIAFASYCSIALLIPVLTNFPLPLGTAGDILGGALLFGLAGFVTALAGVDSGSVYAALGFESHPVGRDPGRADPDRPVLHGRAGLRYRPAATR